MAHPYTTKARVGLAAFAHRVDEYLDRNRDGVDDAGVMADAIERACNQIDRVLRPRYSSSIPFASTSGVADDGSIADIADLLTLANLIRGWDATRAAELSAEAMGMLKAIADGVEQIETTEVPTQARRPVRYQAGPAYVSGNIDGNYTSNGVPRNRGV